MDHSFKLDTATRARIAPHFDSDALERLLQHVEPEARPIFLDWFLLPEFRSAAQERNTWFTIVGVTDPVFPRK